MRAFKSHACSDAPVLIELGSEVLCCGVSSLDLCKHLRHELPKQLDFLLEVTACSSSADGLVSCRQLPEALGLQATAHQRYADRGSKQLGGGGTL